MSSYKACDRCSRTDSQKGASVHGVVAMKIDVIASMSAERHGARIIPASVDLCLTCRTELANWFKPIPAMETEPAAGGVSSADAIAAVWPETHKVTASGDRWWCSCRVNCDTAEGFSGEGHLRSVAPGRRIIMRLADDG